MITIEQRRIIDAMKAGSRLCLTHGEDGPEYFFSDGTIPNPRKPSVDALLRNSIIAPADDGMFGSGQTFDLMFDPK